MEVKEWLGNDNKLGIDIWERKYRHNDESFDEWLNRISNGSGKVKQLILDKKFLFGGRILANRGVTDNKVTYSNCFIAGTKVLTKRGLVNIEDVNVGDEVVTDDNSWQIVNEVMCRDYYGDMYRIKSSSIYDDIVCTPNHKFLTQYGWKRADRLECLPMRGPHDKLKIPNISFEKVYEDVDLTDYVHLTGDQYYEENDGKIQIVTPFNAVSKYGVSDTVVESRKQNAFNRFLKMDSDMMYFIGRWIGDGSVTKKKGKNERGAKASVLQIVFNATKEKDAADRIIKIGTDHFGIKPNVRTTNQNVIAVRWNSETVCNFFAEEFGMGCSGKKIPDKYIGDINIACGLIDADGFVGTHGATKIVLKNEGLIDWLKDTLYMNGINTSKKVDISYRQKDTFRLDVATGIGKGRLGGMLMRSYHDKRVGLDDIDDIHKDYISVSDISIEENMSCKVYNLSVENNHSYTANGVVVHNCYVVSPPEDNIESIFDSMSKLARTFSYGGGCGIDIGKLRPKDAIVNNAAKRSSGAVSFMDLYSMTTSTISQQGRRGALMISIPVSHPDVEEFISVKNDLSRVTSANISIRVDNKFMIAVVNDDDYELHFTVEKTGEEIKKTVRARELFNKLCENNWDYAEPGILFWDEITSRNLLANDENFEYAGINPCAEEPLPAGGSCLLGAINLSMFVKNSFQSNAYFDSEDFQNTVNIAVNALNDVLDEGLPLHPLAEQRESVRNWRQIGLGIMGLADCLIRLGYVYGSQEANKFCDTIARVMFGSAVLESDKRGGEFGAYPMFDKEAVNASPMLADAHIQVEHLNNSQLLTIAPTGTISTMLGISGGIEPIFANSYTRRTQSLHGKKEDVTYKVYTPIVKEYMDKHGITDEKSLPKQFVTSADINPKDRIDCQAAWQKWIDASISSTINLPNEATVKDVIDIYTYAWKRGLKGVTVYRAGCSREGILVSDEEKKRENKENNLESNGVDSEDVKFDSIVPVSRKTLGTTSGQTFCKKSSCGTLYITINRDADGNIVESFVNASKGGICQSNVNAVNRLLSLCLRSGTKVDEVIDQLKGITCPACVKTLGKGKHLDGISCPDIIAKTLKEFRDSGNNIQAKNEQSKAEPVKSVNKPTTAKTSELNKPTSIERCPDCGEPLRHDGGCVICGNCGWSKCG